MIRRPKMPSRTPLLLGVLLGVLMLGSSCVSLSQPRPPAYADAVAVASPSSAAEATLAADIELADEAGLDDFLRYAALHNPGLRASWQLWMAAVERVVQAEALPDPQISYGYYFASVETFTGPQQQRLRGAQTFPWLTKLILRGELAAQAAEAARLRFEARKLRLFEQVTQAWAEYYYLARAIAVTRENVDLLRDWEVLIRAKYRVATGSYHDLINAQVELGKLDDRLRTLEDLRVPTIARLNDVLGRESRMPIVAPVALPEFEVVFEDEELLARLGASNPELGALEAGVEEQGRRVDLAWKEYFPDVTLGVEWIETGRRAGQNVPDAGQDPVIGMVSMNLPIWWQKYSAGVREAEALQRAARQRRVARERNLATDLQFALYGFRDAERKTDLFGNALVPKAKEALAANYSAYESGGADFLDLLQAQRLFLEFGLSYERARADRLERYAEIEKLIGESVLQPMPTEVLP
ncbi:MAG: TolC family protein [Deltaproteobacteria bacterium]